MEASERPSGFWYLVSGFRPRRQFLSNKKSLSELKNYIVALIKCSYQMRARVLPPIHFPPDPLELSNASSKTYIAKIIALALAHTSPVVRATWRAMRAATNAAPSPHTRSLPSTRPLRLRACSGRASSAACGVISSTEFYEKSCEKCLVGPRHGRIENSSACM